MHVITRNDLGRITVNDGTRVFRDLDPDRLETAWLLRLEHNPIALAAVLRDEHGFAPDSIYYSLAADALHRAGITL